MMTQTATVVFDGKVLRPDAPLLLKRNNRYLITIQEMPVSATAQDAWDILTELTGSVEAPADWAAEHDHYLYGTPKHPPPSES